jgi:pimeloyl-ACP methyl ester carboxylesterase
MTPNIVLVHGFWADGSSWCDVIPFLLAKGHAVTAVQSPLTSLWDDAAATRRVIKQQNGPTVIAGHSWGGAAITEAGNEPEVAALVYIAAFGLDAGESLASATVSPILANSTYDTDADGFVWLDRETFHRDFCADVPTSRASVLAAVQKPVSRALFDNELSCAAWRSTPAWYMVASEDRIIAPDAQRAMARNMRATTIEVRSSHLVMVSKPEAVAAFILRAADHAGAGNGA